MLNGDDEGDLPKKAQELVKEWMKQNQEELLKIMNTKVLFGLTYGRESPHIIIVVQKKRALN